MIRGLILFVLIILAAGKILLKAFRTPLPPNAGDPMRENYRR